MTEPDDEFATKDEFATVDEFATIDEFSTLFEASRAVAAEQFSTLTKGLPPESSPKDLRGLARALDLLKGRSGVYVRQIAEGNVDSLVLGKYVLLEKIGQGGMGQVFKAWHRTMKRIAAVKVLPPTLTDNVDAVARFLREIEAAAKLSHPNIVIAYDADQSDGMHFLAMEFVDGCDLSVLVQQQGPVAVQQAVNYVLQAANGLDAAHKKGIVHRDIKPSNLMVDREGTVKILDLGLARLTGNLDSVAPAMVTSTGTVVGTVDYMAPEQAVDSKLADGRADIYSLGCTLFFLLTGKPTYGGYSVMNRLLAHRDQPIPSLSAVRPDVSSQLDSIFQKMVAKKVEDRFQSMSDVIAALERCGLTSDPTPHPPQMTGCASNTQQTSIVGDATLPPSKGAVTQTATHRVLEKVQKKWQLIGISIIVAVILVGGIVSGLNQFTARTVPIRKKTAEVDAKLNPAVEGNAIEVAGNKPLAFKTPEFDNWVKSVQSLPAEQQIEEVRKKLVELNPEFDGKLTTKIHDGLVRELAFLISNVRDISPVRVFDSLYLLALYGTPGRRSAFSDLSPLKDTFLRDLQLKHTSVSDLSPLKSTALTNLGIYDCPARDLKPLEGMKLTHFHFELEDVSDLSPLGGLPLQSLSLAGSQIVDLLPLKQLSLTDLTLETSNLIDISPLKGMPLTYLHIHSPRVSELSAIEGMPLTDLEVFTDSLTDISVVATLKELQVLGCHGNTHPGKLIDLTPLKGMKLTKLDCGANPQLNDLSPLQDMPLMWLNIGHTGVFDLSPLSESRLTSLYCVGSKVTDLSPLHKLDLSDIRFSANYITNGMNTIRRMKSLQYIEFDGTSIPPFEFWKKYDAGEFGHAQPEKFIPAESTPE